MCTYTQGSWHFHLVALKIYYVKKIEIRKFIRICVTYMCILSNAQKKIPFFTPKQKDDFFVS